MNRLLFNDPYTPKTSSSSPCPSCEAGGPYCYTPEVPIVRQTHMIHHHVLPPSSGLGFKTGPGICHLPGWPSFTLTGCWLPRARDASSLLSKGKLHLRFNLCTAAKTSVFRDIFSAVFFTQFSPPLPPPHLRVSSRSFPTHFQITNYPN